MSSPERGIWLEDVAHREDLAMFVERAIRLDDADRSDHHRTRAKQNAEIRN